MTAKKNKHHRIKLWSIRFPVLTDIERIFKQLHTCETFEPCDVVVRLGHFEGIVLSLACILTKQHDVRGEKYLLKTPANAISETLNLKLSLDVSALKNLCLWREFQSRLLFIISLLLKNVLTALGKSHMCVLLPNLCILLCYFWSPEMHMGISSNISWRKIRQLTL